MKTDHHDDPAIAAWHAYSAVRKGYVEAHGGPGQQESAVAGNGADKPAPGRRAEDPALSLTIDRTVETIGADQATGQSVRSSDG